MLFPFDHKIISVHIFTSNHFRTELQTRKWREREQDRSTRSTDEIAPIVAAGSSSAPPSRSSPPKSDPPKTDLVPDPPKTKLVRRAMPKAPVSRPLHSRNPETQKTHSSIPLRRTHSSNPPLRPTHSANPFLKPPLAAADLSLSLSLKSLSHALLLF